MSKRTPLARRVIAALLMVLLTACHTWQPTTVSPQTFGGQGNPPEPLGHAPGTHKLWLTITGPVDPVTLIPVGGTTQVFLRSVAVAVVLKKHKKEKPLS